MTEECKQKTNSPWTGRIALILALVAVFMAFKAGHSTKNDAITGINEMITDKVVPQMDRASQRDVIGHIYDLKRIMVTLEEIKETTTNEDVKSMVDQLRKNIEELNIKLFVHE